MPKHRLLLAALAALGALTWGASRGIGSHAAAPHRGAAEIDLAAWPLDAEARRGQELYEQHCIGCHGDEGAGDGVAAAWLDPRPRNFQSAQFKFRSTPYGDLPLIEDLVHTLRCGLPGSAMPSFRLHPEADLRALAAYAIELALLGRARADAREDGEELGIAERRAAVKQRLSSRGAVEVPPATKPSAEGLARAKALYLERCAACHDERGRGFGSSAPTLRDAQDLPVPPRDFTRGVFRAGGEPEQIFLRLKTGIGGTPMPAYSRESDEVLWDLVHYVRSLVDESAPRPRHLCAEGAR